MIVNTTCVRSMRWFLNTQPWIMMKFDDHRIWLWILTLKGVYNGSMKFGNHGLCL